ncbi:MAG: LysR family transcriptional regulator [Epsilonproteobacteria bacterium]|nr:LysR family transcriptional regulator [Campylobacterota bacterium]
MLKDFSKIQTFLTVVREKSFSKASKKLGISQPAVTQQIKLLEDYVETKIVDRKKNGIRLTKEGEEIYAVMLKLEKCIFNVEKDILKVINKQLTFMIGASFTVGNYILPDYLDKIKDKIKNDVMIRIDLSKNILEMLNDKKIDIAVVEAPSFQDNMLYREWLEDELVLFSNSPLPKYVKKDDLYKFNWICREEESHTRQIITEIFDEMGIDCKSFELRSIVSSSTALKRAIKKAPKDGKPTVSIISSHVIADEVESGILYSARIRGFKLKRHLYIVYLKERRHDVGIDSMIDFLMNVKKI